MSNYFKHIVAKLTADARECLEASISLAVGRTHHEIEMEHLLWVMFEQQMPLLEKICHSGGNDALQLLNETQNALALMRTGNCQPPVLATPLMAWLEQAWIYASACRGDRHITPQTLLTVLITHPALTKTLPARLQQALAGDHEAVEQLSQQAPRPCYRCRSPFSAGAIRPSSHPGRA